MKKVCPKNFAPVGTSCGDRCTCFPKKAIPAIDPTAIREAALREAVKSLRDWQNNLIRHRYKETAITVGMSADVVEALIGEKK